MRKSNWCRFQWLVLLSFVCCGIGCGSAKYEERLQESNRLFEYLEQVDSSLSPLWQQRRYGLSMRLPLPFSKPMPGPEKVVDEDGNEYYTPDERQPSEYNLTLDGIVEAWSTELPDENGNPVESRIYILSNYERYLRESDGGPAAVNFTEELELSLMDAFQVTIPDGEANAPGENIRYREMIPARNSPRAQYTTPVDYTVIRIIPSEQVVGEERQALLYENTTGDIQSAILVICPKLVSPNFLKRLEIGLQTYTVLGKAPKSGSNDDPGGGGGGTSNSAIGF